MSSDPLIDRVLIIRGGALGDFVLGLPALRLLRDAYPEARLELVGPAAVLPLASPLVDLSTPIEQAVVAHLFGDAGVLPEELAERYSGLDLTVLWLADREGALRRNFQKLGARRILWAPALPTEPGIHAADYLVATLAPLLGTEGATLAIPEVTPSAIARREAAALWRGLRLDEGPPVVAIHPGSGGDWKRWPAERFARVADHSRLSGARVVLIQGPADDQAIGEVVAGIRGERPRVVSGLGVEELAAFLALCSCYLGNDSGVTHLAAAVGTPTVAVFGPTDPAVWGPRGRKVTVLREGDRLDAVEVDRVVEVVRGML